MHEEESEPPPDQASNRGDAAQRSYEESALSVSSLRSVIAGHIFMLVGGEGPELRDKHQTHVFQSRADAELAIQHNLAGANAVLAGMEARLTVKTPAEPRRYRIAAHPGGADIDRLLAPEGEAHTETTVRSASDAEIRHLLKLVESAVYLESTPGPPEE